MVRCPIRAISYGEEVVTTSQSSHVDDGLRKHSSDEAEAARCRPSGESRAPWWFRGKWRVNSYPPGCSSAEEGSRLRLIVPEVGESRAGPGGTSRPLLSGQDHGEAAWRHRELLDRRLSEPGWFSRTGEKLSSCLQLQLGPIGLLSLSILNILEPLCDCVDPPCSDTPVVVGYRTAHTCQRRREVPSSS